MAMVQLQSYAFTTVENPLSDGGNFTTAHGLSGPNVPSSGVCQPSVINTGCGSFWSGKVVQTGDSWPADHYSEITIKTQTPGNNAINALIVRATAGVQTYYVAECSGPTGSTNNGTLAVYKCIAGAFTQIGSTVTNLTFNVADVVRFTVVGTTLTVTQNGSQIYTNTDSAVTSGAPGLEVYQINTVADCQISLWAAGANQAATPTFSPVAGTYTGTQTVTITSSTSGGTIYYTTDGTTPTHSSSSISNGGTISVASSLTVKAFVSVSDFADSAVGSAAYVINAAAGGGNGNLGLLRLLGVN